MVGRRRIVQRGRGVGSELLKALGPVAKEVAMESSKYGMRKLVNKIKPKKNKKRGVGVRRRRTKRKAVQDGAGLLTPLLSLLSSVIL